jgi:hypothetical protein
MLTNLFNKKAEPTGYEPKTEIRSTMLQTYAEFGVTSESEAKYMDQKVADLAECAAGLGLLTAAATAVIGAGAAAVTMTVNAIDNNKHRISEKDKIIDYRIDAVTTGKSIDEINRSCRVIKGKPAESISDKMKAAAAAAKEKIAAAKAAAAAKGAKK